MGKREIGLEGMSIEELRGLQIAAAVLERKRRGEQARKEGRAFARLQDIPADERHVHKFRFLKYIASEFGRPTSPAMRKFFGQKRTPSLYSCGECRETAYSCNNCGYVPGMPVETPYNDISCLAGSAGDKYNCGVCGKELGRAVFSRS